MSLTTTKPQNRSIVQVVARNTAFMLGGQILIKIFAFIFNVYVVRRLGDAHFGRYAAALAYVAIFAMFTDLGTSSLAVREMARSRNKITTMVPDVIALRLLLSLLAMLCIPLSAWLLGKPLDEVLGIWIAACGLLLYAVQGPLDSVMIAEERLDYASAFRLLNQVVFMVVGTLLLLLGAGYIGLLIASLLGVLLVAIASARVAKRILGLHFERPKPRHWIPLLRASFPFGISGAATEFARRFDTVFMSFVLTDAAVGWYNVPYNLITMMLLLAQSLAVSMYPTLVKEYDSGRGSIQGTVQRAMRYLLLLSLPMAIGGTLLADRIILLLYGEEFAPAVPVMQIMVWVLPLLFLAEILGRTCSTMHLEKKGAQISALNAALSAALNLILIPRFGVIGAALAMAMARGVDLALTAVVIGPAMLFRGNLLPLLRIVCAGVLMGAVVWLLRSAPFFSYMDPKLALLCAIAAGALVYGVAALALRAIQPREAQYVLQTSRRKLRQLRGTRDVQSVVDMGDAGGVQ